MGSLLLAGLWIVALSIDLSTLFVDSSRPREGIVLLNPVAVLRWHLNPSEWLQQQ